MTAVRGAAASTVVTSDPRPPILFFDGGCALCHGAVRRLLRWERNGHRTLCFAPLEGPTAESLRTNQALPLLRDAVILWTTEGAVQGEAAVGAALDLIGCHKAAKAFRLLPRFLRLAGYRLIARHRHRWFGRVPADCPMPADPARMLP